MTAFLSPTSLFPSLSKIPTLPCTRAPPTASLSPPKSRRSFLSASLASLLALAFAKGDARAVSLTELAVKGKIAAIKTGRDRVQVLKNTVQKLQKFTADDGVYVQRYIPIWINGIQESMEKSCKDVKPVERTCVMAQAMRGHIFELMVAAQNASKSEVLKEIDEILETTDKFIGYAKEDGLT